jgi:hypothetical protein
MSDLAAFCEKMLSMREVLPRIHFSEESRVVPGDDNPGASTTSKKFPESLMVFAVIGVGLKSDLLVVQGTIDTNQYIQSIDRLGFISTLDEQHGRF